MQILLYISMYSHFPYRVCFQTLDTVFPTYFVSGYLEITTAVVVLCDDLKTYPYRYSVLFFIFSGPLVQNVFGNRVATNPGQGGGRDIASAIRLDQTESDQTESTAVKLCMLYFQRISFHMSHIKNVSSMIFDLVTFSPAYSATEAS